MKITLIHSIYTPFKRGGAEVVVEAQAKALVRLGYEVSVITLTNTTETVEDLDGVRVYRIKPAHVFSFLDIDRYPSGLRFLWHIVDTFNISSSWKVGTILSKEKPDLVITHNLKGVGYLVPGMIRRLGIRHYHILHDVQLALPSGLLLLGKEWQLAVSAPYRWIVRNLFGSPDRVISPSQWLLQFYTRYGFFTASIRHVVPNPAPVQDAPEYRSEHGATVRFCYIGQIEEHKGVFALLQAFSAVTQRNRTAELWYVGTGSGLPKLKFLAGDDPQVKICGFIPNAELGARIFPEIDFVVVPSLCYENSPTVIYESFAHGVPVIASNLGGSAELLHEGVSGYSFDPKESGSLHEVLLKAIHHSDNSKKMGDHARIITKEYALDAYIQRILSL